MNCFYIISDTKKDYRLESAEEIKRYLEKNKKCAKIVGNASQVPADDKDSFVIVLGGDGSVLQASKYLAGTGIPILGVNFGTLGFLTEVEKPRILEALDLILTGHYEIEERMAITARHEWEDAGRPVMAFNEFIVGKRDFGHMMTAKVYVDDTLLDTYVADAVLVSTPTGSTAYNLSAFGPVLVPGMEALIITPICSHSLNKRSVVVSSESVIRIQIGQTKGYTQDEATVIGDGQEIWSVKTGESVYIQKARDAFEMVKLGNVSFFDKMRSKLNRS